MIEALCSRGLNMKGESCQMGSYSNLVNCSIGAIFFQRIYDAKQIVEILSVAVCQSLLSMRELLTNR